MPQPQPLQWTVGFCSDASAAPEEMVPATVPGAVQLDWARAHGWPDHNFGDNFLEYGWMEDVHWLYRATLNFGTVPPDQRLFFVCDGVDYRFQVRLGQRVLHEQEGMFTRFEIDLTDLAKTGDVIEVLVYPAPKSQIEPQNREQANQSCKPAVSYGWDFHPRLIPLGIWDQTYLELRPAAHLVDAEVRYELSNDCAMASFRLFARTSKPPSHGVRWTITDPAGKAVVERRVTGTGVLLEATATLENPQLWWPNGHGAQNLYTSRVELLDEHGNALHVKQSRIGVRRVRLVMHPDAWNDPAEYPMGRSVPPITMEVNGRRIFCKGSNWVSPDIFPGPINLDLYLSLLTMVRDAHMNMLRCWGGAIVQKEAFFDLCDEMGIMVWQEFPLGCNRYEGTPHYLKILDQESRSIILRLRRRPSVVLWCGGNELFNAWSKMNDQDLAIRLLNRNCYDLDPDRPFLPTAPVMGMAHGSYTFIGDDNREVFDRFIHSSATAYTEFGVCSFAPAEVLRSVLPPEDHLPRADERYVTKRGQTTWSMSHWRMKPVVEYFGDQSTLEDWCEKNFLLQGEGLRLIFEEARRQWPKCSMALNWCLNEPWPTVGNASIVSWPNIRKPSYDYVVRACRPVLASARAPKFRWKTGEVFQAELWLLNDTHRSIPAGRIDAYLRFGDERVHLISWDHPASEPNMNVRGPLIKAQLPSFPVEVMHLILQCRDHPERNSEYLFKYEHIETVQPKRGPWSITGGEWLGRPGMPVERRVQHK